MYGNKFKLFAIALITVSSLASAEVVDVLTEGRCGSKKWADSVDQDKAPGRVAFALKCEKNLKTIAAIKKHAAGSKQASGAITTGYPTYGYFDPTEMDWTNKSGYRAPVTGDAPCTDLPNEYEVAFFCASGCYAPDQGVLFPNGYENLVDADAAKLTSIMSLGSESTMESPALQESPIGKILTDLGAAAKTAKEDMLHFHMVSGGELKVTLNHPLVDKDGKIRRADKFLEGEFLVKADGSFDAIKKIDSYVHIGRVYNVSVDSQNKLEQIIVAQGYLNGSLFYQNEGVRDLNRKLLRSTVAAHFIY